MNQHPKLESVAGSTRRPEDASVHRLGELEDHITQLETRLAERIERERVLTLELAAARRDLEVKSAYNTMLESAAVERQQHVAWLQTHVDRLTIEHDTLIAEAKAQAEASENLSRGVESLSSELAAERARVSYRMSQAAIGRLQRHRRLTSLAGAVFRSGSRRKS